MSFERAGSFCPLQAVIGKESKHTAVARVRFLILIKRVDLVFVQYQVDGV